MSSTSVVQPMNKAAEQVPLNRPFLLLAGGGLLLVLATAAVVGYMNLGVKLSGTIEAGAVITIITLAAVSIERAFEMFWAVIDVIAGAGWPLSLISTELKHLTDSADPALDIFYRGAVNAVSVTANAEHW